MKQEQLSKSLVFHQLFVLSTLMHKCENEHTLIWSSEILLWLLPLINLNILPHKLKQWTSATDKYPVVKPKETQLCFFQTEMEKRQLIPKYSSKQMRIWVSVHYTF